MPFSIRPHSAYCRLLLTVAPLLLIAACGQAEEATTQVPALAEASATTVWPTPTLALGLPTAPPPAPTLVPGATPPTPTPTRTPSPTPTPTATPLPAVSMAMGQADLEAGNLASAADHFSASLRGGEALEANQRREALFSLAISYLRDDQFTAAAATLNELLAMSAGEGKTEALFYLGQANFALGDYRGAIGAFHGYIERNPEMAPYVSPLIAEAYQSMGDREGAINAYETALAGTEEAARQVEIRQKLAGFYVEDGLYEEAASQYGTLRTLVSTDKERGRMLYLQGYAQILAGNEEMGVTHYLSAVANYPVAYESYLALMALLEMGYEVDPYQRGVVDTYAEAYGPAVVALQAYLSANPASHIGDAHLYLARSFEGLGNTAEALQQLDLYAETKPAEATIEKAKLYLRSGDTRSAIDLYLVYVASFPDGDDGPFAAWWAAALTERLGDVSQAIELYQQLAQRYPAHEDADEALFRAGWLAHRSGDGDQAAALWRRTALGYPGSEYGDAALFWLIRSDPDSTSLDTPEAPVPGTAYPVATETLTMTVVPTATPEFRPNIEQLVARTAGGSYYAFRAKDILAGREPFEAVSPFALPADEAGDQQVAELWLRSLLSLSAEQDVSQLRDELVEDSRLVIGEKLWRIGLLELAKQELESLRRQYADDALASYQLALYFRELGLFRSSILAATSLLSIADVEVLEAPTFIARLAYPIYFADLILPLAERYGYDPRLQFALVRQESLFESFARSGAAAQGLAQVIPDTGIFIAERLDWPDYENEDLFKPYVGLAFGAYYLDLQLRTFDERVPVALSAYNAGPGNAARWYEVAGGDHDQYLETVDFAETRLYIERIYSGFVIYSALYHQD